MSQGCAETGRFQELLRIHRRGFSISFPGLSTPMRPCFLDARSEHEQVDNLLQAVLRIGDQLVKESRPS